MLRDVRRRDGRRDARARAGALELLELRCRTCRPRSRRSTSPRRRADRGAPASDSSASPTSRRRTSAGSASGRGASTAPTSCSSTGYPMAKRPFYTHPDPSRPEFSNSFDLLFRGLELVTGGQRLHRYEDYLAALGGTGTASRSRATWRRSGTACRRTAASPSGWSAGSPGFGAPNVRETTLFPRDINPADAVSARGLRHREACATRPGGRVCRWRRGPGRVELTEAAQSAPRCLCCGERHVRDRSFRKWMRPAILRCAANSTAQIVAETLRGRWVSRCSGRRQRGAVSTNARSRHAAARVDQ